MWSYYVALALRSSARSKALTALVIVLLALGVASCMVSYAVFRATTSDPLPSRSARLYVPQVDNVGPSYTWQGQPPNTLSYTDAMALWTARKASRQTLLYPAGWQVESGNHSVPAMALWGDAVTADFFPMFEVPFRYGSGWLASDDDQHANVVVISEHLNRKLFGGQDSVGRELRLDGKAFRIAGVLDDWRPKPRFFDMGALGTDEAYDDPGDVYIPFGRAIDMHKDSKYATCPTATGAPDTTGWDAYLQSECDRIAAWVELATPADVRRYHDYLRNYAVEQQRLGRFAWAPNVRLTDLTNWMAYLRITPKASSLSMLISASFLLIVLVNVVGLMLARFMRRAPEIGVRRALGASRAAIYRQFLIEGATLGCIGGILGVVLTVGVAILATVVSALYPTWRAAQTQPAWQIKVNG